MRPSNSEGHLAVDVGCPRDESSRAKSAYREEKEREKMEDFVAVLV